MDRLMEMTTLPLSDETVFGEESFASAWPDAKSLADTNFREINQHHSGGFWLQTALYERLESLGKLRIYTARSHGELVGYAAWLLITHEFTGQPVAKAAAVYVVPRLRGWLGTRLIRQSEARLRADGITKSYLASPSNHPIDRLLTASGYSVVESLFVKDL